MRLPPTSFALALAFAAAPAPCQDSTAPETLRARRHDKLAAPFVTRAEWHTDLDKARQVAAREGKLILAHFTRSYVPCGTSIRCERQVLSAPEFAALASDVVLYCHVTAHLDAGYDQLLFAHGGSGWPHHAVLDASGRILGQHPSWREKSVAELRGLVDRAQSFLQAERETENTVAAAYRRLLLRGVEQRTLDLDSARQLLARAGALPPADADRVAGYLTDLEVLDLLAAHDRFDEAGRADVGRQLYAMWRAGKRPVARNPSRDFWGGILLYLETRDKPDLDLYAEGLAALEKAVGDSRAYRDFLAARHTTLTRLR